LLDGVAEEIPVVPEYRPPEGLGVGTDLGDISLPDLEGRTVRFKDLQGRRVLLVNWSPSCGYCRKIAPELAGLQTELEAKGVELVLLAIGEQEANRGLLEEFGLASTVLLQDVTDMQVFPGIGTPSAYLVDEEGRIASELAMGAERVPVMARAAAGHESGSAS
jgi:thiol-disulfide isomerase/thioredoxin